MKMSGTELMLRNELTGIRADEKRVLKNIEQINKMYPWNADLQKAFHDAVTEYVGLVNKENEVKDLLEL